MSTPRFTPGPWRFGHCADGERYWIGPDYDRPIVADVPRPAEADARLIAAAPELFEALRTLLEPFAAEAARHAAEERARSALAKAGGETAAPAMRRETDRPMETEMDDAVLFENADWVVTAAGLEHKRNAYFIEREQLDMRRSDGLWNWPLQLAEKTWCTPKLFAEAFMQAVAAYGIEPDAALALSLLAARRPEIERQVWDHVARELGHRRWDPSILDLDGFGAGTRRRTGLRAEPRIRPERAREKVLQHG